MRKLVLLLAVCAIASMSFGVGAITTLDGKSHSSHFKCGVCHSPHITTIDDDAPLWGLADGTENGTYSSAGSTMELTSGTPGGSSLMCMGCHDGTSNTVAMDAIAGINAASDGDINTANTHPISMEYVVDSVSGGGNNMLDPDKYVALLTLQGSGHLDSNDNVQCQSCHEIHTPADTTEQLREVDTQVLCGKCHIK